MERGSEKGNTMLKVFGKGHRIAYGVGGWGSGVFLELWSAVGTLDWGWDWELQLVLGLELGHSIGVGIETMGCGCCWGWGTG